MEESAEENKKENVEENTVEIPATKKGSRKGKKTARQHPESNMGSWWRTVSQMSSKNTWFVGITAVVLSILFLLALLNNPNRSLPPEPEQSGMLLQGSPGTFDGLSQPSQWGPAEMMPQGGNIPTMGGMSLQQYPVQPPMPQGIQGGISFETGSPVFPGSVASFPQTSAAQSLLPAYPNCPIYQNYASSNPQTGGLQPVALVNPHAACPSFTQCFPPTSGGMQPVAFTNPHAGCPNFTQCFPQGSAQAVALTNPVMGLAANAVPPPIFRDATMRHVFRGICETCHIVNPDVPISSAATPTHGYRGVCSNCHVINASPNMPPSSMAANAPPIFRDAVMRHAFRGVCENCHVVNPDIPIMVGAQMTHAYRGVCSNCHVINGLPATAPMQK